MKLYSIDNKLFSLDGGAMFGVVPKVLWQKKYPVDKNNNVGMATRSLLIDTGERIILIDNGVGDKHSKKFMSNMNMHSDNSLKGSIEAAGYQLDDITDNFLTHLHFDHCGGGVVYDENSNPVPYFKNADYYVSEKQFKNAVNPNIREGASYFPDNYMPLKEAGKLKLIKEKTEIYPGIELRLFDGHTDGQMIPFIKTDKGTVVFMADLIPFTTHLHLPYIMSYDVRPLVSMKEKEIFLEEAVENEYILFFQHDYYNECCTVKKTEKGFRLKESFKLTEVFN